MTHAADKYWFPAPGSPCLREYLACVEKIATAFWKGESGFLFGAGLSCDSCLPDGTALPGGAELARRLVRFAVTGRADAKPDVELDRIASKMPFEAVMRFALKKVTQSADLLTFLQQQLGYKTARPSDGHKALAKIRSTAPHLFPKRLFTLNFDLLLEDTFRGREPGASGVKTVTPRRFQKLGEAERGHELAIVHMHGALADEPDEAGDIWAPEANFVSDGDPLFKNFASELSQNVFVFVGCSFSDADLRRSYHKVVQYFREFREQGKKTYIVVPVRSEQEYVVLASIWEQIHFVLVPATASRFLTDLAEHISRPALANYKHSVNAAMGVTASSGETVEGKAKDLGRVIGVGEEPVYESLHFLVKGSRLRQEL